MPLLLDEPRAISELLLPPERAGPKGGRRGAALDKPGAGRPAWPGRPRRLAAGIAGFGPPRWGGRHRSAVRVGTVQPLLSPIVRDVTVSGVALWRRDSLCECWALGKISHLLSTARTSATWAWLKRDGVNPALVAGRDDPVPGLHVECQDFGTG